MPVKKLKHHVVPHPKHKHRATLLRNRAIAVYSLSILTLFSFLKTIPAAIPGVLSYASNITAMDLLKYTNARRETAGVNSLTINPKLTEAAQKKAEHMFKNNYWAHVAPDGTDPWSFIIGTDYDYLYAGENLAKNFSSSKDVVEAWYKSPSHRDNLISGKYTDVGFAIVNGVLDGYETTLVVQMFGKATGTPAQVAVKGTENNATARSLNDSALTKVPTTQVIPESETVPTSITEEAVTPVSSALTKSALKINLFSTVKMITLSFACFMFALFTLDIWYSKKHTILKLTGHSLAHMVFLVFTMAVIFLSLQPGRLI